MITAVATNLAEVSDALVAAKCSPKQRQSDGVTVASCPMCRKSNALEVRRSDNGAAITCTSSCDGLAIAKALGLELGSSSSSQSSNSERSSKASATSGTANVVCMADVVPESVEWLWPKRIPFGKLTVLDGDAGLGKSTLTLGLAALVSSGRPFFGSSDTREPTSVVVMSLEDGLADTIAPRLQAAGADMARVHAFMSVGLDCRTPTLPGDLPELERIVVGFGARLVIVDPLMAVLGGDVNAHRDQDVRRALAPLAAMADRTSAAVLIVRHLNKSAGGPAIYRGGGSVGIGAAARSVLLVAKDPDDSEKRVLASVKNNLAPTPPSLRFGLVPSVEHGCSVVGWGEECALTADQLLAIPEPPRKQGAFEQAVAWLKQTLANSAMLTTHLNEAAAAAGISSTTLKRARSASGVEARRAGYSSDGHWVSGIEPKEPNPDYWASLHRGPNEQSAQGSTTADENATSSKGTQSIRERAS